MFLKSFGIFSLLAFSTLASPVSNNHASLNRRDYPTIKAVLDEVIKNLNDLTSKAKTWKGEAIDAVPILDSSAVLLKSLQKGYTTCSNTTAIGLTDAISILMPVNTLNNAVDAVVNALIDKKPLFDKAFLTIVVSDQLIMQKEAAVKVIDAVIAKLPAYVPGVVGTTLVGPVLTKLDKAITAFKPKI
jgi:hypothetical protein